MKQNNWKNNWKNIWEKRDDRLSHINLSDTKEVFLELKRLDGYDIADGGIPYDDLLKQYQLTFKHLGINSGGVYGSVFEVGCGSGANLYLFKKDGVTVGGIDYSQKLIDILKKVFDDGDLKECICGEAIECPVDTKYDAVFSDSVFHYFPDLNYAVEVMEKMVEKSRYSIGITDVYDIDKKQDYLDWRIKNDENYEERYKDLPKLFYSRKFFEDFAQENNLKIDFVDINMAGYWNNDFTFNCFMYKR